MPRFYLLRPSGAPVLDGERAFVVHGFKVPGFKTDPALTSRSSDFLLESR